MLAGLGGLPCCFQMDIVRRGVDDAGDRGICQDFLVAGCCVTAVFFGKCLALVLGAREARNDLKIVAALNAVGKDVGPPAHAQNRYPDLFVTHVA